MDDETTNGVVDTETFEDNDVSVLNYSQTPVIYQGVPKIWLSHPEGTEEAPKRVPFTYGEVVENVEIQLDFSEGDMQVYVPNGCLVKDAKILKPIDLKPDNIPQGMYIAGVGPGIFAGGEWSVNVVQSQGAFVPNSENESVVVSHGMGCVPDEIFITAVNPSETAVGIRWLEGKSIEFAAMIGDNTPVQGQVLVQTISNYSVKFGINESDAIIHNANPKTFTVTGNEVARLLPGVTYIWRAFGGFAKHTDVLYLELSLDRFGILNVYGGVPDISQLEIYVDGNYVGTVDYLYSDVFIVDISRWGDNDRQHEVTVVPVGETLHERYPKVYADTVTGWLAAPPIYGVSGLFSESPVLERTDDAVGMSYSIDSTGSITSDFNSVFPWNEAKLVADASGNQFVQMPEMYFRVEVDDKSRITDIAVSKTQHPDGNWYYVSPFCYGRYGGYVSSSKLMSKSGYTRTASYTRTQFRTYASNNGANYHQLDLYHKTVMNFLWWIEFATKDSMAVMTGRINGSGTSGGSTKLQTGRTNSVVTPSGYEKTYGQMRFHYIEDFIGNLMEWVDGIFSGGSGAGNFDYVTNDASKYSDSNTNKQRVAYENSGNGCIAAYGWDPQNPFLCTPTEHVSNANYDTYFCDYVCRGNNKPVLYTGAAYNGSKTYNGTAYFYGAQTTESYASIGARLMHRGNIE